MYKGSILKKRSIGVIFTLLMLGAIESQAQCLVGGTDFETSTTLCNPQLANDETGWFSETVATLLKTETAGCSYYDSYPNVIQKGMPTNRLNVPGEMITPQAWTEDSLIQDVTRNKVGYSAIVANPKLISPILSEGSGNNMLVNFGTSHDGSYVLGYSVSGLEPGATVTMSFNLYNLIDLASLKAYVDAAAIKRDIRVCGNTYNVTLDELHGQPDVKVTYSTSLNSNGALNSASSTVAVKPGTSQKITIPAKADAYGTVTFYIGRNGGQQSMPIGIDDIEITATSIKPTASIKPENCFGSMISMSLKNQYPAGTKFDWKEVDGSTISTTSHALFEATTPDKNYSFQCEVTLPDGCSAKTDIATTSVVTCCDDGNGNALPYTDIYFEDFGHFVGNQYTYVDLKGVEKTVTVTDHLENNQTKAFCVEDLKTNGDAFKNIFYNPAIYNSPDDYYAISNESVYSGGVTGDHTTNGNGGGFMMIDLQLNDVYYNQPIFEKQICGLCPDREVTFDVYFAGINGSCPSDGITSRFQLQLVDDATNDLLVDKNIELRCGADWDNFNNGQAWNIKTSSEGCVTMKIIYLDKVIPATGGGDFAIDDIRFQVCTPPDVKVTSSLAEKQLLDLCSDEPLTMSASLSSSAANYYGAEIGYLFQYTYQDPNVVPDEDIVWFDLGDIQTSGDYTIENPSTHEAFINTPVGGESKVFFRVVVGRQSYLENRNVWVNMSALSPCRDVSISSAPLTTSLNCAKCYQSGPIDIKGDIVSTIKDAATGYDVYELCYGEELKLNTADVTTVDKDNKPYADYTIHWYKDDQNGTPMTGMTVSPAAKAKELVVKNNNTGNTVEEHIYYVQTVDNFDPSATNCQNWDAVKVILHPKPAKPSITIPNFCDGTTAPTVADVQSQVLGYKINWLAADSSVITTDPDFSSVGAGTTKTFYLNIADATTGCVSDSASFTVTVDTIPSEVLAPIADFCEGDKTAMLPTSDKGYKIVWSGGTDLSQVKGATTLQNYTYTLTDPKTGCVSGNLQYTFTVMPKIKLEIEEKNVCDTTYLIAKELDPSTASISWNDAIKSAPLIITDSSSVIQYEIFASQSDYCNSDTIIITPIFEVTPKTVATKSNVVKYLKVNGQAGFVSSLLTDSIIQSGNDVYWSKANGPFDVVPTIPSVPSNYTAGASTSLQLPSVDFSDVKDQHYYYWVYQQSAFGCVSEPISILLSVLGAPAPDVKSFEYCINSEDKDVNPFTASATFSKQSLPNVSYELVFYKDVNKTTIIDTLLTPKPDVTTVGKVTYYVTQRDKNNHNNESTPMPFDITVYDVADLTLEKVVEYCVSQAGNASEIDVKIGAGSTYVKSESSYYWGTSESDISNLSSDGKAVPSFTNSDTLTYYFQPYYEIKDKTGANVLQVCKGDIDSTKVQIYETKPATTTTIQYIAKESKDGKTFPILTEKKEWTEDSDFDYYYSPLVETKTQPANLSSYSKGAPAPSCDVSTLNGQTKTFYTWVYRINTKNPKDCPSEPVMLTINISDAVSPIVKPYFVCQGVSLTSIEATINTQVKSASEYILKWYGTDENAVTPEKENVTSFDITLDSSKEGEVTYYVTQYDKGTKAESPKTPIKITILANPITKVNTPPTVCEKEVDLASTWEVTNVTDALTTGYLNGTTELASSKVTESGTYTITNKYVNNYSNIGAISVTPQTTPGYCVGTPVNVTVTIDTLSTPLISGSLTACPGIQEGLKASALTNVKSGIDYSWSGDSYTLPDINSANGDSILGGTTNSTKLQTFTYTVTATAGTCSETSAPHTITVGDGPVEGLMTATETDNSLSQFMFTDDNGGQERVVYACGNELTLNVNYNNTNSVAGTEFTWYDGATSIGTGASIQIPETTSPATKTYEVKYFNKCAASAKVTVHFVPLGIDPTLAEMPLTLCEGNSFNLKFEHNSSAILQPQIKWFKNGTEIANETKNQYTIASTTSADNGKYGFEISFKGCKESVTLTDLTVIPAISVQLPTTPTICEGEEVDLEVTNIQPQGTTVSWQADATIVSGENSSKATVKPTYTGGASHQAEYVYTAVAFNSICNSTERYPVKVLVDEALSGNISGRNAICENESTTLNATAYDASTYTWKEGATVLAQSGVVTVKPLVTTTYEIEMTRGKCSATDNYMVEVTTNPVIISVDSVGIRDRQVITATDKGTAPFEFWVDENSANASVDDIFKNLTFTTHVAHIKDINGCQTSYQFSLEPPAISVPEFFTPNGDGVNDNWVVGSLAEVYPGAVVTIFDRFGKTLIQFLGADADGWDGTYKGVPMPSTDYWYMIDIEEIDKQYSGHFTLMRR